MRVRTLEIRWHDSKPISTCDFQPVPFKKARPAQDKQFPAQAYRLATGGEDNHVRVSGRSSLAVGEQRGGRGGQLRDARSDPRVSC